MSRVRSRYVAAVLCILGLGACGGHAAPGIPQFPMQFQRAESLESSGTSVFTLGDGTVNSQQISDMRVGADGKLYYSTSPSVAQSPVPTSGEIGSFDFTTHAQVYQTVAYLPGFLEETSAGVWVGEANNSTGNPAFDRYTAIGGTDTPIPIPIAKTNGFFGNGIYGGIAIGADGQLWWGTANLPQVGEIDQSSNAVTVYTLATPAGGFAPSPQFMTLGSDQSIWVTDTNNDNVYRVASTGSTKGTSTFTQLPQGPSSNASVEGIIGGADKNIYTGTTFYLAAGHGAFDRGPEVASPTFTSLALPSLGIEPYVLAAAGKKIYFNDLHFSGLGIYNTATGALVILPLAKPASGGIAVDSTYTPWLACTARKVACIERVALSSTWAVYPSSNIKLYTLDQYGNALPPGLVGIGELGNSGPFTVGSSNAAICTASVISGFDHDIQVNPVAPGTCTLTVTDAHARSANVAVTVVKGKGMPQLRVRGLRP